MQISPHSNIKDLHKQLNWKWTVGCLKDMFIINQEWTVGYLKDMFWLNQELLIEYKIYLLKDMFILN